MRMVAEPLRTMLNLNDQPVSDQCSHLVKTRFLQYFQSFSDVFRGYRKRSVV